MKAHISFFDAIAENKRNSVIMMGLMFVFFLGIVWAFSYFFDLGNVALIIGFFVLFFYAMMAWFAGGQIVLSIAGATKASRKNYPFLYHTVEGLATAAGIPTPEVYIIRDPAPNAFATGRDPQHASIAVTTGLLEKLERVEIEGVIAHEISHIANYDIRFMTLAVVFAGAIALLSDITWRTLRSNGLRNEKRGGTVVLLIIALALLVLSPFFAELIRFAISRQREYLADANGARLTRYPEGIASALEKIEKINIHVAGATEATAPLYFSNPAPDKFAHLFSTHPPIKERVKRLRAM